MSISTRIMLVTIAILWGIIIFQAIHGQRVKAKMVDLKHAAELSAEKLISQKERETRTLIELNSKNAELISKMEIEAAETESNFKVEINELKTRYDAVSLSNKRLRDQIGILNGQLSNYSRETVENYATTAANNLAECGQYTTELERLALEYNSEIERYQRLWPKQIEPTIEIFDEKTGAVKTFPKTIRIKADLKDIEPVLD